MTPLLTVEDLSVTFPRAGGEARVIDGITFSLQAGQCLVIVGESGSGKSICCQSILGIVPEPARVTGRILWKGRNLTRATAAEWRALRGVEIAMVFQDPTSALNPLISVGRQIEDVVLAHRDVARADARARAVEVLRRVEFPDPERRMRAYPGQLSGGLRQRVAIALALACEPSLILADEPTTNLDVSVQAQIMTLLRRLKDELGLAILFVTHDLGLAGEIGDDLLVMYAGHALERGPAQEVLRNAAHPYTQGLIRSAPTLRSRSAAPLHPILGQTPDPLEIGAGAPFRSRCPVVVDGVCDRAKPGWTVCGPSHEVACHRHERDGAAILA